MVDYTVTINGLTISDDIERDSYSTSTIPVYSDSIQTMNGVDHFALLRNKGSLTFSLNPRTAARTQQICAVLLVQPCTVVYFDLEANASKTATMSIDQHTAKYLSRCLSQRLKWNEFDAITLTEL